MRISDWSSDVCSSDLNCRRAISDATGAIRSPMDFEADRRAGIGSRRGRRERRNLFTRRRGDAERPDVGGFAAHFFSAPSSISVRTTEAPTSDLLPLRYSASSSEQLREGKEGVGTLNTQ